MGIAHSYITAVWFGPLSPPYSWNQPDIKSMKAVIPKIGNGEYRDLARMIRADGLIYAPLEGEWGHFTRAAFDFTDEQKHILADAGFRLETRGPSDHYQEVLKFVKTPVITIKTT